MTPETRFTIFHSSLPAEGLVVENPIGWDTAVISLERHKEYHSLVEEFKGNFMWLGTGMQTLKQIKFNFGPNAIVRLEIDVSYKTGIFVNLFTGRVKLLQAEEIIIADRENYKMTAPIIRDDFWTKFINRSDSQVDLEGTVDVDGAAITPVTKIVLPMPSQKIQTKHEAYFEFHIGYTGVNTGDFMFPGFTKIILEEVKDVTTYPTNAQGSLVNILWVLQPKETGDHDLDIRLQSSLLNAPSNFNPIGTEITWWIKVNDEAAVAFTKTDLADWSNFTYLATLSLNVEDIVKVYGIFGSDSWEGGGNRLVTWGLGEPTSGSPIGLPNPSGETQPSYFKVTANTIFEDSETDAFLIKDAAESIISKLVGQDVAVKSDYLDTCKGFNAIFRGKHLRGYDFATKQFSMSWDEWWKGANPLLFLGLGYTEVSGVKKIEIESRASFYDAVPVVSISNINDLVRRYDIEKVYKSIDLKYKKGLSESASGIDDTQTSRSWNTDLEGEKATIVCEWMAASLAIERSRRNRVELNKDDRNDEEIMVVALVEDGADWLPEFGTVFNAITNLLNSDFRINIRHSATRLFKRAQSWFNGCMLYSTTGLFTFDRGEGNYEMTSQLEDTDCEAVTGTEPIIDEGGDIAATDDFLFVPEIYEAKEVPMSFATYQTIVENRKKALGISRTAVGHVPMHIIDLGYTIHTSRADLLLLQATEDGL